MSKASFLISSFFLVSNLFLFNIPSSAQETFTISGTIQSATTGETLIGVSVQTNNAGQTAGAASNEYGFYSLSLPRGTYSLEISALGMQYRSIEVILDRDKQVNHQLEQDHQKREAGKVTAQSGREAGWERV